MNKFKIIAKILNGSHLYGMATEESDLDYKGIYLPSKEEYDFFKEKNRFKCKCLNRNTNKDPNKRNTKDDIDYEIFSLIYFIRLAIDGQTVAIDMVHAPKSHVLVNSDIWSQIVSERHKLYSKSMNAFVHYARNQAAKYGIKGSRLDACKEVIDILAKFPRGTRLKKVWGQLPNNDHQYFIEDSPAGLKQYMVVGKTIQETMRVEYCHEFLAKFYDEYGERAKQAQENKGIDWKAISHALRACYEIREIVETGTLNFPLVQANYLRQVKLGKHKYPEVAEILENEMEKTEKLITESNLPEKADKEYWFKFLDNIYKM